MSELRNKLEKNQVEKDAQEVEELGLDPRSMLRFSAAVGAFFSVMWWIFLVWMASHVGIAALVIVGVYVLWRATIVIRGAANVEDVIESMEAAK